MDGKQKTDRGDNETRAYSLEISAFLYIMPNIHTYNNPENTSILNPKNFPVIFHNVTADPIIKRPGK